MLIFNCSQAFAEFIEPSDAKRLAASALKEWRPRVLQLLAVIAVLLVVYLLAVDGSG